MVLHASNHSKSCRKERFRSFLEQINDLYTAIRQKSQWCEIREKEAKEKNSQVSLQYKQRDKLFFGNISLSSLTIEQLQP